ncbi:MAG TPA: hypothetical protein DCS07_17520 [Bdellovibrionales bacterium]|nr:MAG: hypothetical protein A2X97_08740 [Bdellovibrionales bacterium GWA1_52_35]OFZ38331.1 MAG: hypothetical protein A2070_14915 [Bdellovibrionales bacterium GWC1_52_8]HAR44401.1 hypothetical protein [Bdellovibrionales bacterium]HCM38942.1 hypothetical protein [Bdellovibrionales bacterium]
MFCMIIGMETEKTSCERCGAPGARQYEHSWFCDECYQTRSSSDLEEGGDDLWKSSEEEQTDKPDRKETKVA